MSHSNRKRMPLDEATSRRLVAAYAAGVPVGDLLRRFATSSESLYAAVDAAGVPRRTTHSCIVVATP